MSQNRKSKVKTETELKYDVLTAFSEVSLIISNSCKTKR